MVIVFIHSNRVLVTNNQATCITYLFGHFKQRSRTCRVPHVHTVFKDVVNKSFITADLLIKL